MLLLVSKFMRSYSSLLPTPQRNSFIPALLMTFVKKSMNLIRFPQISSSTFILFTNSNHGMAITYFHLFFLEMFLFFFKTVSPWYSMELSYPLFVSCVAQNKCNLKLLHIFEFSKFLIFRPCQAIIFFESLRNHHDNLLYKSPQNFWCWISKFHQTNH